MCLKIKKIIIVNHELGIFLTNHRRLQSRLIRTWLIHNFDPIKMIFSLPVISLFSKSNVQYKFLGCLQFGRDGWGANMSSTRLQRTMHFSQIELGSVRLSKTFSRSTRFFSVMFKCIKHLPKCHMNMCNF